MEAKILSKENIFSRHFDKICMVFNHCLQEKEIFDNNASCLVAVCLIPDDSIRAQVNTRIANPNFLKVEAP